MEIILLFLGWSFLLYLIHLLKERRKYKQLQQQHYKIYIPSLDEITNQNYWMLQLVRYLFQKMERKNKRKVSLVIPYVRRKISWISFGFIGKKSE